MEMNFIKRNLKLLPQTIFFNSYTFVDVNFNSNVSTGETRQKRETELSIAYTTELVPIIS